MQEDKRLLAPKLNPLGYYHLNTLAYGNPTIAQNEIINKDNEFEYLLNKAQKIVPFSNNSKETFRELNYLLEQVKDFSDSVIKEYEEIEDNLHGYLKKEFDGLGVKYTDNDFDMLSALSKFVLKLKYIHSRPRPNQLACYYNIKLFPLFQSKSPSFPSIHTLHSRIITTIIQKRNPDKTEKLEELFVKIKNSRIKSGVHYPSDNNKGYTICNIILEDATFVKKYLK